MMHATFVAVIVKYNHVLLLLMVLMKTLSFTQHLCTRDPLSSPLLPSLLPPSASPTWHTLSPPPTVLPTWHTLSPPPTRLAYLAHPPHHGSSHHHSTGAHHGCLHFLLGPHPATPHTRPLPLLALHRSPCAPLPHSASNLPIHRHRVASTRAGSTLAATAATTSTAVTCLLTSGQGGSAGPLRAEAGCQAGERGVNRGREALEQELESNSGSSGRGERRQR